MADFSLEFLYDNDQAKVGLRVLADHLDHKSKDIVDELVDVAAVNLAHFMPKGKTLRLLDSIEISRAGSTGTGIVKDVTFGGFNYDKRVMVTAPYAAAVDSGSGVHGPTGTPLKPSGNAFLLLKDPDAGRHSKDAGKVYTPSIKGQRGQEFSLKAFEETAAYARVRGLDLDI